MHTNTSTQSSMRLITYWLSLGMIFIIPWENVIYLESVGTISRAAGLLVAGFWILTVLVTGCFRRLHAFHLAALAFVLWNGISVAWSLETEVTLGLAMTYFQLFAMVLILWDIYTTSVSVRAAMQAYVFGAFVIIASVLDAYLFGGEDLRRYTVTGFNPNSIGFILSLGMPIAWYLAFFEQYRLRSYWLRLLNFAYIPSAFAVIMLTGSRAAMLGAVPLSLFMIGTLRKLKPHHRFLLLTLVAGSLIVLASMMPDSTSSRITNVGSDVTQDTSAARLNIWYEGIRIFGNNPILGVGSGAFRSAATETGKTAHNFVISLLAETGIVGFSLFMAILVIAGLGARFLPKPMAWLWLTVFLIWVPGALTHNWLHEKTTWLFLGLALCAITLPRPREGGAPRAGPTPGSREASEYSRRDMIASLRNPDGSSVRRTVQIR